MMRGNVFLLGMRYQPVAILASLIRQGGGCMGKLPMPLIVITVAFLATSFAAAREIVIADERKTEYVIILPAEPTATERLAADELVKYLRRLSGAEFPVQVGGDRPHKAIAILRSHPRIEGKGEEAFAIIVRDEQIHLAGGSGRALLYATYALLERLGCRFLAPELNFYNGQAEHVPGVERLSVQLDEVISRPAMKFRKLYVEEGLSHTTENLRKMIEWMPKAYYNTLVFPSDYQGRGRVTWDQWRVALTPELQKRGIIIEVGGHGYQNFLNAKMEDGTLFERHPEWFGVDEKGQRSRQAARVFCTSNSEAVEYLTNNVIGYVQARPEIDIFDLWPPDGARWCECPDCEKLGEPQDRQALLVNHVNAALKQVSGPRLEVIAYSRALLPPRNVTLDADVLVDFCPINQSFEDQITEASNERNAEYSEALQAWREQFAGDISLYSYYRKYAWRSMPVVFPEYMQDDIRWYAVLPLQGVSSYAEPGDWATYELNHYMLGRLAWEPEQDVHEHSKQFAQARFGEQWELGLQTYRLLERVVPRYSSIPFTSLKSAPEIERRRGEVVDLMSRLRPAAEQSEAMQRLVVALEHVQRDLEIQQMRASDANEADVRAKILELVAFLEQHKESGVVLMRGEDEGRFLRRYGLK